MSEANYRKQVRAAVRGLWTGAFTFEDFDEIMKGTIRRGMTQAWIEGARTCGITFDDLSDNESLALSKIISEQFDYINGFRDFIDSNSKVNKGKLNQGLKRAELWINRYGEAKNQAMVMACADKKLKWQINAKCKEHCFPAGAMVKCLDGSKPIEEIRIGDFVLTSKGYYKVTKLFKHYYKGNLIKIFSNNQEITSTPNHPFLVNGKWERADKINLADKVMLFQNTSHQFFTHIAFPYSLDNISARCKIFVLNLISFLLGFLSICQSFKSWVSMPVVTVGLNNKVFNSNIYNKIRFNDILMLNMSFTKVIFPSALMPTNGAGFPINSFMPDWAYINSGFVSTSRGTEVKSTLPRGRRIYKPFKLFSTILTNKSGYNFTFLFTKIWMSWLSSSILICTFKTAVFRLFVSGYKRVTTVLTSMSKVCHKNPLLHQSNVTDIQVSYNQSCYVYNLEVEKTHNYTANGFLVHNCNSCQKLNGKIKRGSYWQKTIMPRSRNLECGGWRCCCDLVPTDDPISKGKLSF